MEGIGISKKTGLRMDIQNVKYIVNFKFARIVIFKVYKLQFLKFMPKQKYFFILTVG